MCIRKGHLLFPSFRKSRQQARTTGWGRFSQERNSSHSHVLIAALAENCGIRPPWGEHSWKRSYHQWPVAPPPSTALLWTASESCFHSTTFEPPSFVLNPCCSHLDFCKLLYNQEIVEIVEIVVLLGFIPAAGSSTAWSPLAEAYLYYIEPLLHQVLAVRSKLCRVVHDNNRRLPLD
ncbi:hypothetical protein B7463_g10232, partial [Scytalidium lignicola]